MPQDPFYNPLPDRQIFVDGIFKGGSTAGVAYAGSLLALARNGVWFKRVAGTSAGAITAATIAAGYDANEIDYLAAPKSLRRGPPNNLPSGVEPLDYVSVFSDLPLSPGEVTLETRRNNIPYRLIDGSLLTEVSKLQVPIPALDNYIDKITEEVFKTIPVQIGPKKVKVGPFEAEAGPFKVTVLGQKVKVGPWKITTPKYEVEVGPFSVSSPFMKQMIRNAVIDALLPFPKTIPVGNVETLIREDLRKPFADAIFNAFLMTPPFGTIATIALNFYGDGGLLKGDTFLKWMRKILEAKVGKSPVLFEDLPMHFSCVACDVNAHEMEVYSSETTKTMEVAEAVRRSMSIPLLFEPRRESKPDGVHEIMDGGIMDNYPVGFFLARDNGYFTNTPDDMQRLKVGFFPKSGGFGSPAKVEKVFGDGIFPSDLREVEFFNRIFNIAATNLSDSPLLRAMLNYYKESENFYEVEIGLSGKEADTLNFLYESIKGSSENLFNSMCAKGWDAGISVLSKGIQTGKIPLPGLLSQNNPY